MDSARLLRIPGTRKRGSKDHHLEPLRNRQTGGGQYQRFGDTQVAPGLLDGKGKVHNIVLLFVETTSRMGLDQEGAEDAEAGALAGAQWREDRV